MAEVSRDELKFFQLPGAVVIYTLLAGFQSTRIDLLSEDTLLTLIRINAWITPVAQTLIVQETSRDSMQGQYRDVLSKMLQIATSHLVRPGHLFDKYWALQVICNPLCSGGLEDMKRSVLSTERGNYHPSVPFYYKRLFGRQQ